MQYQHKTKNEKGIRQKFEDEIADAEKKLFDYREKQLAAVRGVLTKNCEAENQNLLGMTLNAWIHDVAHEKHEREIEAEMKLVQERLKNVQGNAKENSKQAMM